MTLPVVLLGILLGAVTVSAGNVPLNIDKPQGLIVALSPDSGSILISRMVHIQTSSTPPNQPPPPGTTPSGSPNPLPTTLPVDSATNASSPPPPPPPTTTSLSSPPLLPSASPTAPAAVTTGVVNVTMTSIRELDVNMTEVVATPSHNFNGFAGLNLGSAAMPGPPIMGAIQASSPSVQTSCQAIMAPLLSNNSALNLALCAVQTNGSAFWDNEKDDFFAGQLALAIDLENWPWTTNGTYLEFNFTISVPSGRKVSQTSSNSAIPVVLGLGVTGSYAVLSSKVTNRAFDLYSSLPSGYPLISSSSDNTVTVSLLFGGQSTVKPTSIVWNAIIDPGYQPGQNPPGPVAAAADLLPMWIMQVATVALACLVRFVH